jgi:hypothetical protein
VPADAVVAAASREIQASPLVTELTLAQDESRQRWLKLVTCLLSSGEAKVCRADAETTGARPIRA